MKSSERGGIVLRLLNLLVFVAILALLYMNRVPLLRTAGRMWVFDEPPAPSDVIIVLGDDNYAGDRAAHAAQLFHANIAPLVVASGRFLRPNAAIPDLMDRDLQAHGVPAASILKFPQRAANTRDEARGLRGLVLGRGWKRILVVTSNYHARRAHFVFTREIPGSITVRLSAAHDSEFDPEHWWETRLGTKLFLNELLGSVAAWWELRDDPAVTVLLIPQYFGHFLAGA